MFYKMLHNLAAIPYEHYVQPITKLNYKTLTLAQNPTIIQLQKPFQVFFLFPNYTYIEQSSRGASEL